MNLFAGRLEASTNESRFISSALEFILKPELAEKLKGNRQVTVGIRPEHLCASNSNVPLHGQITAIERHAGQSCLYLQNNDTSFAVKTSEPFSTTRVGDLLNFEFSLSEIVFFDTKTGLIIKF